MLRVFLDLTSPLQVGKEGRLKWRIDNASDQILADVKIVCTPCNQEEHVIMDATLPPDFLMLPSKRATLHQTVDLKRAQDRYFAFHFSMTFRTLKGDRFKVFRTEVVELGDLPQPGKAGKMSIKGNHVVVDNHRGGQGKSIRVEGQHVLYLNSDAGTDLEIEGENVLLGDTPGLGRDNGVEPKGKRIHVRSAIGDEDLEFIDKLQIIRIQSPSPSPTPPPDTDSKPIRPTPSSRVELPHWSRRWHIVALDQAVFGRWDEEGNDQADILLKTADSTRQRRISAAHFQIYAKADHFIFEDVSSLGARLNGAWPGKNNPLALKPGMLIELTHSVPGLVRLRVAAMCRHLLILESLDQAEEGYVLAAPETPASDRPADWDDGWPWLWHHQGGFWPLDMFSLSTSSAS